MSALTVRVVTSRINAECRAQGVSTVLLAKVMGVSTYKARAVRSGTKGRVNLIDVIAAARALDVPLERLVSEVA